MTLSEYYEGKIDADADPAKHDGFWKPWIRDYNALDDYEDFEDVMKEWFTQNGRSEDITSSTYYETAMQYKAKWKAQIAALDAQQSDKQAMKLINYLTLPLLIAIGVALWALLISCYRKYYAGKNHMVSTDFAQENTPLIHGKM